MHSICIELSDTKPVRRHLSGVCPPKLQIFKQVVNELLELEAVRPSKSQFASAVFLVPKSGGFRMLVDVHPPSPRLFQFFGVTYGGCSV